MDQGGTKMTAMLQPVKKAVKTVINLFSEDWHYYRRIIELIPELSKYKEYQIEFVKETAQKKNCRSVREYYELLCRDPAELARFKQNLTYVGSHFFRGEDWLFFSERCLSSFRGADRVRIWCAACSSGQEVYSIIAALSEYIPLEKIDVLASDYNDEMIAKCEAGTYFNMHLKEIPEKYHALLEKNKTKFTFKDEVRKRIATKNVNLLTDVYPDGFDIILCRNVLKFFSPDVIEECHGKLCRALKEGGFLFLSNDDNSRKVEFIKDPEKLGMIQLEDRCIYQKRSV